MTDVPGVLRDKNDPSTKIHELNIRQCRTLIQEGVIAGGMIPKVRLVASFASACDALGGVRGEQVGGAEGARMPSQTMQGGCAPGRSWKCRGPPFRSNHTPQAWQDVLSLNYLLCRLTAASAASPRVWVLHTSLMGRPATLFSWSSSLMRAWAP